MICDNFGNDMSFAYILLAEKDSNIGRTQPLNITINITPKSGEQHKDTVLAPGFSGTLRSFAEDALAFSRFYFEQMADISQAFKGAVITAVFGKSREVAIDEEQSASAGLILFTAISAKLYEYVTQEAFSFAFAATGDISDNDHRVKKVSLLTSKLKAAAKVLRAGDKVFFPSDNLSDIKNVRSKFEAAGIDLIPVTSLKETLEQLLGIELPSNDIEEMPLENYKLGELEDAAGQKYESDTSFVGRLKFKYIYSERGLHYVNLARSGLKFKNIGIAVLALSLLLFVTSQFKKDEKTVGQNLETVIQNESTDTNISAHADPLVKLTLSSDLPANILVDGKLLVSDTKGPVEVDVTVDSHKISFVNTEFDTTFSIFASPQKRSEFICRYLTSVNITSELESGGYKGALVLVNDYHFRNTYTPATIHLKPGSYKISINKLGFDVIEKDSLHLVPKLNKNSRELHFTLRER